MQVNVLGTPYTILYKKKKDDPKLEQCCGYCDHTIHTIVIEIAEDDIMNIADIKADDQRILRHELTHAFLFESGLGGDSSWATDEEMVDWIARQFTKMFECFKQVDAI